LSVVSVSVLFIFVLKLLTVNGFTYLSYFSPIISVKEIEESFFKPSLF